MISNETKKLLSMIITASVISKTGMALNDRTKALSELGTLGVSIPQQKDEKFNAKTLFPVVSKRTEQFKAIKKENVSMLDSSSVLDSKFIPAPIKSMTQVPIPVNTGNIPIPPEPSKVESPEETQKKMQQQKEIEAMSTVEQNFIKSIQVEGMLNNKIVLNGFSYKAGEMLTELSQIYMIGGKESTIVPKLLNFDKNKVIFEINNKPIELNIGVSHE